MGYYVDAHFHIWDLQKNWHLFPSPDTKIYQNYGADDIWHEMRKTKVKYGVFVQVVNNSVTEAEWAFELAEKHPFIRGVVAGLDLASPQFEADISKLLANPLFRGVRHILDFDPDDKWLTRANVHRGFEVLQKYDLTYDLLVRADRFDQAIQVAKKFSRLKLVLDHIGKPDIRNNGTEGWEDGLMELGQCPNVYCKLSGVVTEANLENWTNNDVQPYLEHSLRAFGQERCMFGSDWPVCTMANGASYSRVVDILKQSVESHGDIKMSKIFSENAVRFYNLELPA